MARRNETLLCAELTASTIAGMIADLKLAKEAGADVAEIRMDCIKDFKESDDVATLLADRPIPVIISCRVKSDGGELDASVNEAQRIIALQRAAELGADYVEIELPVAAEFIKNKAASSTSKVIVSSINLQSTPSLADLEAEAAKMSATGADIVKIVTKATNICDCKRVFDLLRKAKTPTIAYASGIRGEITRELAPKYNAFLTYAPLHDSPHGHSEADWAPPTVQDLLQVYLLHSIHPASLVFGVCANPVGHSKSPLLLNAAMVETGVDGVYVPFLVDAIEEFFDTFDDFAGFSVTLPHKTAAMLKCEEVDPTARAIGAVNNVVRRADKTLFARNTDWGACTSAIEDGLREKEGLPAGGPSPLEGRLLILAGAGGAGRALSFGATQKGAILVVADLDLDRAKSLASIFGGGTTTVADVAVVGSAQKMKEKFAPLSTKAPVLAHMTPVGMVPNVDRTLFTQDMLEGYAVVFDAVYTPPSTRLLKEAKAAGATPVSGVEMFVRQGADQFFNFTGRMPSKDIMRAKLLSEIQGH